MKDSDPRPMPASVLRAYRDPIQLRALLESDCFDRHSCFDAVEDMVYMLSDTVGDPEVTFLEDTASPIEHLPRYKNLIRSIPGTRTSLVQAILDTPDFGGEEVVLPILAKAMSRRWFEWWSSFRWTDEFDITRWRRIAELVLGDVQIAWISVQCARSVLDMADPMYRRSYSDAADQLELFLSGSLDTKSFLSISRTLRGSSRRSLSFLEPRQDTYLAISVGSAFLSSIESAVEIAYQGEPFVSSGGPTALEEASAAIVRAVEARDRYSSNLSGVARRLITPTLITSASRGLR